MAAPKISKAGLNWYSCWPRVVWEDTGHGFVSRTVTKADEKRREKIAARMSMYAATETSKLST